MKPENTSIIVHLKVWLAYTNIMETGSPEFSIE